MTKSLLMILIKIGLNFLREKKILARLEQKTTFALICFVIKTSWFFQSIFQVKNLKTRWIYYLWLMVINRIMYTWMILTDLSFKNNQKYLCKSCLQCFSNKNVLTEHKKVCLRIYGAQSVRLEKGTIAWAVFNYRVWIHSEPRTWHDKNIRSNAPYR